MSQCLPKILQSTFKNISQDLVLPDDTGGLTSVLGAQPQHEADGEDLGPGRLPLLDEDAEEVGGVWQ